VARPTRRLLFTVQPALTGDLIPHAAGGYAGAKRLDSFYGSPLRLAADPRRFDVSRLVSFATGPDVNAFQHP